MDEGGEPDSIKVPSLCTHSQDVCAALALGATAALESILSAGVPTSRGYGTAADLLTVAAEPIEGVEEGQEPAAVITPVAAAAALAAADRAAAAARDAQLTPSLVMNIRATSAAAAAAAAGLNIKGIRAVAAQAAESRVGTGGTSASAWLQKTVAIALAG